MAFSDAPTFNQLSRFMQDNAYNYSSASIPVGGWDTPLLIRGGDPRRWMVVGPDGQMTNTGTLDRATNTVYWTETTLDEGSGLNIPTTRRAEFLGDPNKPTSFIQSETMVRSPYTNRMVPLPPFPRDQMGPWQAARQFNDVDRGNPWWVGALGAAIPATLGAGMVAAPGIVPAIAASQAIGGGLSAGLQAATTGRISPLGVVAGAAGSGIGSFLAPPVSQLFTNVGIPGPAVPAVTSGTLGAGLGTAAQVLGTGRIDPAGVAAGGVGSAAGALTSQAIGAALQTTTPISTPTPLESLPPPVGLSATPVNTSLSPTPATPSINTGVPDLNPGIFGTATGGNMPLDFRQLDFSSLFGPSAPRIDPGVPGLNLGIFGGGGGGSAGPTFTMAPPTQPGDFLTNFGQGFPTTAGTSGAFDTFGNMLRSLGAGAASTLGSLGTRLLLGSRGPTAAGGKTAGGEAGTPGILDLIGNLLSGGLGIATGGLGLAGANALGGLLGLNRTQQPTNAYSTSGQAGFAQFPDLQSQLASLGLGATQAATGAVNANLNAPINFPSLLNNGLFPQQQQAASQLLGPFANRLNAPVNFPQPQDNGLFPQQQPAANQLLAPFVNQLNAPINFPQLQDNGLFPQQQAGVDQLSRQMLNMASSDAANRGMLSPQNTSAVAGSALQNMLPALLPMISQNIQEAAITPEQIAQARLGQFGNVASMFPGMAGQNVLNAALFPERIAQERLGQFGGVAGMFPGLAGQNVISSAMLPEQIRQQRIAQLLSYMAATQGALGQRQAAVGHGNFESFLAALNQGFGSAVGRGLGGGGGMEPK